MNTIRGVNCEGLPSRRKRHARERLFSAAFHRTRIPFVLLVLVVPPRPANFPSIFVPSFDSNFDTPRHHLKSHRSSRKFRFSRTPFPLFPQRRHVHFQFIGTKRRYLSFIDPPRVRSFIQTREFQDILVDAASLVSLVHGKGASCETLAPVSPADDALISP